jgi:hypothetical protein
MVGRIAARPYPAKVTPPVPQVDVVPDGFDWANLFIGTGGLLIAVAAFLISLWVQRRSARSVIDERRRLFELDILRELATGLDDPSIAGSVFLNPHVLDRFALRLELLSERLPLWDQVLAVKNDLEVADLLGSGDDYRFAASEPVRLGKVHADARNEWIGAEGDLNNRLRVPLESQSRS